MIVIAPWTAFNYVVPTTTEWGVMIIIGIFTQIAQYFMTRAYQAESAANISNLNYLGILYASVLGFAVFQETLEALATIGIVTIVASAIVSTKLAKRRKPEIVA
jgi:drug/metabolite transporter (DMT)-like permease